MKKEELRDGMRELAEVFREDDWEKKLKSYWYALRDVRSDHWGQALALWIQDGDKFPKPKELHSQVKAVRQRLAGGKGFADPCSECGDREITIRELCAQCFDARHGSANAIFKSTDEADRFANAAQSVRKEDHVRSDGSMRGDGLSYIEAIVKAAGVDVDATAEESWWDK